MSVDTTKGSWQTWALSAAFTFLMMLIGWQYTSISSAVEGHAMVDARQNERIAVLENELTNLKQVLGRMEGKLDEVLTEQRSERKTHR